MSPGGRVCVCVCVWWGGGGRVCLCVHLSIVNGRQRRLWSQPTFISWINHQIKVCLCLFVLGTGKKRVYAVYISSTVVFLLNCFHPPPVPDSAVVVVILFPSAGKWHQVMSSPIKSGLKCVRFQAITRIVRDRERKEMRVTEAGLPLCSFMSISPSVSAGKSSALNNDRSAGQLARRRRKWLSVSGNNRKSLQLQLWFFKASPFPFSLVFIHLAFMILFYLKSISKKQNWSVRSSSYWCGVCASLRVELALASLYEFSWKHSSDERKQEGK